MKTYRRAVRRRLSGGRDRRRGFRARRRLLLRAADEIYFAVLTLPLSQTV
jgi:hypothetical protein